MLKHGLDTVNKFVHKNAVMCIALAAAAITCFFVPPDKEYINYFDFRTLTCLFCVLAVVCALRNIRFFYTVAQKIVQVFKNARTAVIALVCITFIGSMLIANDMALITFLPLGYFVLTTTNKEKYMAVTFILQNIAANLGGMLTPFGNPQNLYLYSKFEIPTLEFMGIMVLPFLLAITLIFICCVIFIKPEPLSFEGDCKKLDPKRVTLYLLLFALAIAIVFRGIPYWIGLVIIPIVIFFADKRALANVDYPLLLTFVFFFIFSGNLARIGAVKSFFAGLLSWNTLVVSTLSCQCISNVPTAILLSQFTENYKELLMGVNIGGVGTLISSLASLITFREYQSNNPGKTMKYIALFSALNFSFLAILLAFCYFLSVI